MNKKVLLQIPMETYEEIIKDLPRSISIHSRILELLEIGLNKGTKLTEQPMKTLLSAVLRRYEADTSKQPKPVKHVELNSTGEADL